MNYKHRGWNEGREDVRRKSKGKDDETWRRKMSDKDTGRGGGR